MTAPQGPNRYSSLSILLHWLTLALLIGVYVTVELGEGFPRGSERAESLEVWHFTLGLSVLALVWLRIVARLIWPAPAAVESGWRNALSRLTHAGLYTFMIGMPLAGWLILSAEGEPVPFFGLQLPALIGPDHQLAEAVEEIHEAGGIMGYWLIGLHAAAALFHHFVLRDRLIARMLPGA